MAYRRSLLMEERLANNRDRILTATRKLVAEGGFREAQIAAVAAVAGISTGMIYRYFPSKAELFVEVLGAAVGAEIEILTAIADGPEPAGMRLSAAVTCFVRRALHGPNLAYAFIIEPVDPEVETARIRYRKEFGDVFKAILIDGVEKGELPAQDVDASAACIVGAFTEALVGPIGPTTRNTRDKERLVESVRTFCLRAVGGVTEGEDGHEKLSQTIRTTRKRQTTK
ncbi:putative TetR family transcriptional regulator [Candidatus Competibacter denitrificans Run_A_D11]|uniref:TetR family transcriptional regulator n=1 Tax=Candidatus Competibacter denitrificans Run_A_D11 TaxID=1400863 RepID=W6M7A4_9GAMM|nr:TetR/AcrR family transcriptional regulator [Candidatus Competibacter denitrificans]CDI03567.1 putative TetR family transcriptional regulator [Candidatus Competibacter denitrificans Run_A_D11]HAS86367.1 TetR/AcrR family transcriptional regulator [Candidatus Competibacteraceae bacterium]HRC70456.1 TetR/AcrR family transcriptional regulator [Candidatus Competibacter denitrificans]